MTISCPRAFSAYLLFSVTVTGALVMVVEIAGARVIAPYFGVGLFVWTALISVTLLSLAAGYAAGGWLADRKPDADWLYAIIGLSGLWLLGVPWIKAVVLQASLPLGLRAGAFFSACVLFGPALLLLGAVSPYVVRLAAKAMDRLGRTVGVFYAVSTAGSFVGALGAGFFLLAHVGVGRALTFCGVGLLAVAAGYFVLFARRPATAVLPVLAASLSLFVPAAPVEARLADGTEARIVAARDSFYGQLKVIDYRYGARGLRELTIDGLVQGAVDLADGQPASEYFYVIERLPLAILPQARRALVIGLGAGLLPAWYARQGLATEAVDIDPAVAELAHAHFGLSPAIPVHIEDARAYLARPGVPFDVIVVDVFNGDTTPAHLLSVEAIAALKARLSPGGVVVFNLMGRVDGEGSMLPAVARTVNEVFAEAVLYPLYTRAEGEGNVVMFARDGSLQSLRPPQLDDLPVALKARVEAALAQPLPVGGRYRDAEVLTDDFNPLDVRDLAFKERIRRNILEATPAAFLAHG